MTKEKIIEIFEKYKYKDNFIPEESFLDYEDFEEIAEEIQTEFEAEKQELIEALKIAIKIYKYCEKFAAYYKLTIDFIQLLSTIDIESILEKHTGKPIEELLKKA